MPTRRAFTASILSGLIGARLHAQPADANYDEAKVPAYTLPPILTMRDGRPVRTRDEWRARRAEILDDFSRCVYGRTPVGMPVFTMTPIDTPVAVLDGRAWRQQIRLEWGARASVDLLVYRPRHERPVPVFIGLNFAGNHAVDPDPAIRLSTRWMRPNAQNGIVANRATEQSRGTTRSRWPVDLIIERDCAVMTAYYGDLAPDDPSVVHDGVSRLATALQQDIPAAERWGAIGMWAWGLSQMRLAAAQIAGLDAARAAVIGHSRLGKAALWAGAQDEAFAMVVSNDSGEGGAAISRRMYGETIARITSSFPHWFCPTLTTFADRVPELPVDQHQLLALVAPRALHVGSATEDRWADPRGEFLATQAADQVWTLLGVPGLGATRMPDEGPAVGRRVRYHIRSGGHDVTRVDWEQYLTTATSEL
ncbi:MAG: acetylxylan esterase [Acidobacteria bacterium]|nr:acetylxylan esterase [Acidobacteriota bacterium]